MSSYTANMDPNGDRKLGDFVKRYRESKDTSEGLVEDLLVYAEKIQSRFQVEKNQLQEQIGNLRLDLQGFKKTRKDLERRVEDMEARLRYTPDNNPYVLILIDGNGLLFKQRFVQAGHEGGKKAADELQKAANEMYNHSKGTVVEIFVKIIANVSDLSKAMVRSGCVANTDVIYDFITGFNHAKGYFDMVDVCPGREQAAAKIIECAQFNLRNFNCKNVLLGVSHDPGYASFITDTINGDGSVHGADTKSRLMVIEGCKTAEEIVDTGIGITSFRHIFRSDRLSLESPEGESTPLTSPVQANGATYAAVTRRGAPPPPKLTFPITLKKSNPTAAQAAEPCPPAWNPGPRGLDPYIPLVPAALDRVRKRRDALKPCNNHFLRGHCLKSDRCEFDHTYKPTNEEIDAISYLARLNPCINGQDCKGENCIYGHHCPSVFNNTCTYLHCKFHVDEHPTGTKFKYPRSPDT
ncbi:hypothetical protein F4677DRAFT_402676 [Hypoxylon crocopeplum]|nr:hypothetical protein F4677DRAFT_402676 [Hypoxylon crocopeplum]